MGVIALFEEPSRTEIREACLVLCFLLVNIGTDLTARKDLPADLSCDIVCGTSSFDVVATEDDFHHHVFQNFEQGIMGFLVVGSVCLH